MMKQSENKILKRCPKTGKIVGYNTKTLWGKLLFPIAGILAIAWFLFRVVPKPDRIAYPCQKVAMSIGGSFLTYFTALMASYGLFKGVRRVNLKVAYASVVVFLAIGTSVFIYSSPNPPDYKPILTNIDGANNPMGEPRGIFPGRVTWVQDFNATSWDDETGWWWQDEYTNQEVCDAMFEKGILSITGATTVKEAWQRLFEYNNQLKTGTPKGYTPGEKIAIKVNLNPIHKPTDEWHGQGYPSPQMVNAMIKQLIEVAGVRGEDILIADPSRFFVGPLYEKIRSNASDEYRKIQFIEKQAQDKPQHLQALPDTNNKIYFNMPDGSIYRMCLPQCFTDASYIIDYALVRPHRVFGITNVAKNHFGSVWDENDKDFKPNVLHAFALWDYPTPNKHKEPHSNPVLLGHKTIYNKTLLYLADGLYTPFNQGSRVQRFSTMNDEWLSSLYMSLDPVALESVCFDFITSEPNLTQNNPSFNGNQDSQLHESAMAGNPPSGTKYDPEQDGSGLYSLGVHEHWNNAVEKKYSRNLGKEDGIELVSIRN